MNQDNFMYDEDVDDLNYNERNKRFRPSYINLKDEEYDLGVTSLFKQNCDQFDPSKIKPFAAFVSQIPGYTQKERKKNTPNGYIPGKCLEHDKEEIRQLMRINNLNKKKANNSAMYLNNLCKAK